MSPSPSTSDINVMTACITAAEARALTDRIKATADELWRLLLDAYDRRAWEALGYVSWREYAKHEFSFSQGHLYRLLDQGKVLRAIQQAAGSPMGEISERICREVKPHLALVTTQIADRVARGEDPAEAVEQTIAVVRTKRPDEKYVTSRRRGDVLNRFVTNHVADLDALIETNGFDDIDVTALDRTCFPQWTRTLRDAAERMVAFAARLERQS